MKDACMMTYTKNTILVIDWPYETSRAHKNGRLEQECVTTQNRSRAEFPASNKNSKIVKC